LCTLHLVHIGRSNSPVGRLIKHGFSSCKNVSIGFVPVLLQTLSDISFLHQFIASALACFTFK
jgi:hypothetical protein